MPHLFCVKQALFEWRLFLCQLVCVHVYSVRAKTAETRNSSADEIANVNFLYDDIVHALEIQ